MSHPSPSPAPKDVPTSNRHLWQIRWVRDLAWITLALVILLVAYLAREIVAPALIGLGLAYAVNPVITCLNRRTRIPRALGTGLVLLMLALLVALLGWLLIAPAVSQVEELIGKLPTYVQSGAEKVEQWLRQMGIEPRQVAQQAADAVTHRGGGGAGGQGGDAGAAGQSMSETAAALPWNQIGAAVAGGLNLGASVVTTSFGFLTYLVLAPVVTAFSFFFFSWHLNRIFAFGDSFVPPHAKQRVHRIAQRMDKSVAAFIRGRFIQAAGVTVVLSLGWMIVGVPYWLLLGLLGGMLNLIPYAAIIAWPLAVLLAWFESMSGAAGFSAVSVLLLPTVVYVAAQSLDGWVVEPIVQGQATALDPLSVMLAVLIGASLMGLLGMILAIPLAACGKILAQELILPALRPAPAPAPGSAPPDSKADSAP
jgi:predicted PurR-regulated permease PerM